MSLFTGSPMMKILSITMTSMKRKIGQETQMQEVVSKK